MSVANLSNVIVSYKVQSAMGTPSSGAGATGLEVTPSRGMSMPTASIESALIRQSKLRKRPRQGSKSVPAAYETELMVGAHDTAMEAVLGGTWVPAFTVTEADVTSLTISGTGTILTNASGSWITEGVRAGMTGTLASMSVAGNNSKRFPIVSVTAGVITIPTGILADNATDATFTLTLAKSLSTTTPYLERYFTVEEYMSDLDIGKRGTDLKFHQMNFTAAPDQPVKMGFALMGRDLSMLATGSSPNFTSPVFISGPQLVLLDGAIYVNGVARTNLTGFDFGFQAPATTLPVLGTRISPDVFLGEFAANGNFTGIVADGADFASFTAEDRISVHLHCAEREADPADFVDFYLGNMAYGGYETPAGGEGALIQTIPLNGGEDDRGAGYAATSVLISTSAA